MLSTQSLMLILLTLSSSYYTKLDELTLTNWLERGDSHAGIILGQQNYSVGEQMRRLLSLISAKSAAEMQNQIEFISAWSEE